MDKDDLTKVKPADDRTDDEEQATEIINPVPEAKQAEPVTPAPEVPTPEQGNMQELY